MKRSMIVRVMNEMEMDKLMLRFGITEDDVEASEFQSTPPCRGLLDVILLDDEDWGFNPRPRVGGYEQGLGKTKQVIVSIHAPV